jgi:small subunit ribosomal protein S8
MIIRIKNAVLVKKRNVLVLRSNLVISVLKLLQEEGFIDSFEECGDLFMSDAGFLHKYVSVNLRYKGSKQKSYITNIKRISKPGYRVYLNYKSIPKILGGVGVAVFVVWGYY